MTVVDLNAELESARLLYPVYRALALQCVIDVAPCLELEQTVVTPAEDSIEPVRKWFSSMDETIGVHQLRHFLQTSALADDEILGALLSRHLAQEKRNESCRNKVDFLLVQLFSLRAASHLTDNEMDLAYVMQILEPVLGHFHPTVPEGLETLDELTRRAQSCKTLKELFTSRTIEQVRKLKDSCGEHFFDPIAMAAFTRCGFLLRRLFFRLMQQDLNAILDGLRELESRGVESLDCRKAEFSAYEPLPRLRMICLSWKVMFHAEYSSGQPLCLLVDLRTVVDAALMKTTPKVHREDTAVKSMAAAAGGRGEQAVTGQSNAFREWTREPASPIFPPSNHDDNPESD